MEANVDGYSFHVHGDSDCGGDSDSSIEPDDEIEILLHGTPEQKRKIFQQTVGEDCSSDEDDFEKLMENELNQKLETIKKEFYKEIKIIKDQNKNETQTEKQSCSNSQNDFYNDIYFDSDDETETKEITKRKKFTDDELFYDPNADTEDEIWVNKQREKKLKLKQDKKSSNVKPLPNSDAVLNCPSCMTTLCLDCQRHASYKSQYRAMFVMNCIIKHEELLHYKQPQKKTFKRHRNRGSNGPMSSENFEKSGATNSTSETTYNPVNCATCSTEVAVFDNDEIYHFFNVLASHC